MKFICFCGQEFKQLTELLEHYKSIHVLSVEPRISVLEFCPLCGHPIGELIAEPRIKQEETNGSTTN